MGGVLSEKPSVVKVMIVSGTTQSIIVRSKGAHQIKEGKVAQEPRWPTRPELSLVSVA